MSWKPDREVKAGPFQKFCHAVGLCEDENAFRGNEEQFVMNNVHLVFCPPPRLSDKAKLSFQIGCVLRGGDIVRMGDGFTSWIDEDGDSS